MKLYTFYSRQNMPLFISILKNYSIRITVLLAFFLSIQMNSQVEKSSELYKTIEKMDSIIFENGFNKCLLSDMEPLISEDLEFYHDKSGLSTSKKAFIEAVEKNICSDWERKLIRKLKNGMEVFPLYENNILYGAIQIGVHEFYIKEKSKELYLVSIAKFTHVWVKETNQWKLKRVLSYDHQQPKLENSTQKTITLSEAVLKNYVGQYIAPNVGEITISIKGEGLEMYTEKMTLDIFPQTETLFFNKNAPLTFEFIKDTKEAVLKMIVRENGNIVEEAKKVK